MTKPLFASKWFKDVPAAELRQEIQNLYREIAILKGEEPEPVDLGPIEDSIADLEDSIADLEAALTGYLPLEGGTLTGPLHITNAGTMTWTNSGNVVLNFGGGNPGFIRNGGSGSSLNISGGTSSTSGPNIHLDHGAANGALRYNGNNRLTWDADGVHLASAGTATTNAVRADRTISAGNGLTGGGNLTANRSIALGTPSSITSTTTNSVTSTSHTHALVLPSTRNFGIGAYALATVTSGSVAENGTVSGNFLRYAGIGVNNSAGEATRYNTTTALTGTWRNLGPTHQSDHVSLFVRVA